MTGKMIECADAGVEYTGERMDRRKIESKALLQPRTEDAKVVARAMEKGLGLRKAHILLSQSRYRRGLEWVGVSAVYSLHRRDSVGVAQVSA